MNTTEILENELEPMKKETEEKEEYSEEQLQEMKFQLKKEIELWIQMKHEQESIKKEYNELKSKTNEKETKIKHYMKSLGGGRVRCGLHDTSTWEVNISQTGFKPLSRKRLNQLIGEEECEKIWNNREKNENTKLKCKEIKP